MSHFGNIDKHPQITTIGGHNVIGGLSHVYHCNYYNAYLQMTVLLTQGMGDHNPERLLTDSVTALVQLLKQRGYSELDLLHEFAYCGFGMLQQLNDNTWETPHSHYGKTSCLHSKPQKNCYFTSGYLQGLLEKRVEETECKLLGAPKDKFMVFDEAIKVENYLTRTFELQTTIPERFAFEGCQDFSTRVDEEKIIAGLKTVPLYGQYGPDETGLIEVFGAILTNQFMGYYNRVSYETYFALRDAGVPAADSKEMFIQAGHVCAFNTFGRIMNSPEWYNVVVAMCETKEDWLHSMIAVINMLGWGIYRVEKMDSEQELIVRVYNSYEGVGFRRMYPPTDDKNMSFLAMGATLGLVHLLWKVDIRNKPALTPTFYVEQFNHPDNSYQVEQTHAIAAGDDYDRFIVSK
ncbi:MAG: hypothetical protein DRQ49_06155 [Gammaproteobacteria bacterium]|nr:MAG: hypothetical protein DRQ49_06155 [Gammaproteobacteria bacterium]RKZ44869.1 MAG: hypothetical protein DRQ41_01745 [Gammaproteobacteria bacterium]RKZ74605.1 MAG: hypothetical protein DRQ57_10465 [Gammaproteobacteria bacterium]